MLRSLALLLEHAAGRTDAASAVEGAVDRAIVEAPTPDLGGGATTDEFTNAVVSALTGLSAVRTL
jgi:3-isopropylmalate dehydrogenase